MINAFPILPNQIHLAKISIDEWRTEIRKMIVKNTELILILMEIVYYCWFCCCCYYYHYPVTLGHYKFACVPAVLRDIHDLYVGCLASVKAAESTSDFLFY